MTAVYGFPSTPNALEMTGNAVEVEFSQGMNYIRGCNFLYFVYFCYE